VVRSLLLLAIIIGMNFTVTQLRAMLQVVEKFYCAHETIDRLLQLHCFGFELPTASLVRGVFVNPYRTNRVVKSCDVTRLHWSLLFPSNLAALALGAVYTRAVRALQAVPGG
jgi:hypothetical protein